MKVVIVKLWRSIAVAIQQIWATFVGVFKIASILNHFKRSFVMSCLHYFVKPIHHISAAFTIMTPNWHSDVLRNTTPSQPQCLDVLLCHVLEGYLWASKCAWAVLQSLCFTVVIMPGPDLLSLPPQCCEYKPRQWNFLRNVNCHDLRRRLQMA